MKKLISLILYLISFGLSCADYDPISQDPAIDPVAPPTMAELQIPSGGAYMNAHIYIANGAGPHPTAVFLHGFPGNERNIDLMQALRRAGFNTLFFHYRGSWGSQGDYRLANILEDANAAVDFVRIKGKAGEYRIDAGKVSLVGHSMGGFNALATGAADKGIQCTAAMSPANLPLLQAMLFDESGNLRDPGLKTPIQPLGGYSLAELGGEIRADMARFDLLAQMGQFKGRHLMLVAANQDRVTPLASIQPLIEQAKVLDKAYIKQLDSDHSYSGKRIRLARELIGWMSANCR